MQTINPDKQNVEQCLRNKSYLVDFYQREYVWSKETAYTLLDDIFYNFELDYPKHKDSEITQELIIKYNWYYLNVYITNQIDGKKYIVDGQQRLTTLTLIAVKLYHLLEGKNDDVRDALKDCIFSNSGYGKVFNIDNNKRKNAMDYIFNNKKENVLGDKNETSVENKTEQNIIARYNDIGTYFDKKFKDDDIKIIHFSLYFLGRLVLCELDISQNDTPMVFEVINDRGEALEPFEILKGKLLGALNKEDIESFCKKWEYAMSLVAGYENKFFSDFIKSKFLFKRNSDIEKAINNAYHRYIFEHNNIANELKLRKQDEQQINNTKNFIEKDICYYAKLYSSILESNDVFLTYCEALKLSGQYQNILAACEINDKDEQIKIQSIAKEYDRLYILLNLNGIYDSNEFQEITYQLNDKLKNININEYREVFNDLIKRTIKEKRNVQNVESLLDFQSFVSRNYENMNTTLLRYLFARVEQFICDKTKQSPKDNVFNITTKTGDKNGYHIEHILSRNEANLKYFESKEEFDAQRNLLGGLLLLKGRVNISSGNEEYQNKLKTYSASLVWGHSLCPDFYHSTNKDFLEFNDKYFKDENIKFKPYTKFNKTTLQERSKLLYEIVKIIWEVG